MYINFQILNKHGLSPNDLLTLIAIKQKESEELICSLNPSSDDEGQLTLVANGLIAPTKKIGFKITKEGTAFLRDLGVAEVTEDGKELYADLIRLYHSYEFGSKVGSKTKGLKYFSQFLAQTNFTDDQIKNAVDLYLGNVSDLKYVRPLDKLVFKPDNVYSTKFKLEESKLAELLKK